MAEIIELCAAARLELPPLDNTMGVMLVGVLFSGALWGVSLAQVYGYFSRYNDRQILRAAVIASFIINTLHQCLISHTVYTYLVTWYRNFVNLENVLWSLTLQELIGSLNIVIVQCFLIWRVWLLSGHRLWYIVPLIILALAQLGSSIAYYAKSEFVATLTNVTQLKLLAILAGGIGGACNTAIASVLIVLLHRSKSGFKRSNHVIQYLIILSITTGLVISLFHIMTVVVTAALPDTLVFTSFYFPVIKLYTNSFLMTLNVRDRLQGALVDTAPVEGLAFAHGANAAAPAQQLTIHVTSDVTVDISPSDPDHLPATDTSSYELHLFESKEKANIFNDQPKGSIL